MQLTSFTDYSLRVLIFLGTRDSKCSITEMSQTYGISKNHIVKVVHNLAKLGYVNTTQGKGGGVRLALPPKDISLGELVAKTENFQLVECFRPDGQCVISPVCKLKAILTQAQKNFIDALNQYTLESVLENKEQLKAFLV